MKLFLNGTLVTLLCNIRQQIKPLKINGQNVKFHQKEGVTRRRTNESNDSWLETNDRRGAGVFFLCSCRDLLEHDDMQSHDNSAPEPSGPPVSQLPFPHHKTAEVWACSAAARCSTQWVVPWIHILLHDTAQLRTIYTKFQDNLNFFFWLKQFFNHLVWNIKLKATHDNSSKLLLKIIWLFIMKGDAGHEQKQMECHRFGTHV